LEVAVAGEQFESRLDEGLRIQRNEIGLVAVNTLVSVSTIIDGEVFRKIEGE
jgi:hypothetical protein